MAAQIQKLRWNKQHHKGAVFLYVLFSVSLFMLVFSSLIFFLNRNLDFVAQAFVRNRLAFDSASTSEKVIGLFQSNPQSAVIIGQSSGKRDVQVTAYQKELSGYVYPTKSDIIRLQNRDYMLNSPRPTQITVERPEDSTGTLMAIFRRINPVNNYILSIETKELSGSGSLLAQNFSLLDPATGLNYLKDYPMELVLASASPEGALFTVRATSTNDAVMLTSTMSVSTTSYENLKSLGTGQTLKAAISTTLEDPSYNIVYKSDFETGNVNINGLFSSSLSEPGISTSYIDTFLSATQTDYTVVSGNGNWDTSDSGLLTIGDPSVESRIALLQNVTEEFDVRVLIRAPATFTGESGIYIQQMDPPGTMYRAGVKNMKFYYVDKDDGTGTFACQLDVVPAQPLSYVSYTDSLSPENFGDGSDNCSTVPTNFPEDHEYDPAPTVSGQASSYMLRFVRSVRDNIPYLDVLYCNNPVLCEDTDGAWYTMLQGSYANVVGPVQVGFYALAGSNVQIDYFRVNRNNTPGIYEKRIDFGRTVELKKIAISGFKRKNEDMTVWIQDMNEASDQLQDGTLIFTPNYNNAQGDPFIGNSFLFKFQLKTDSGDYSEIPFIRGLRIYYEPE